MEPGDIVEFEFGGETLRGVVIPRTAETPENIVIVKLENGYNVGIDLRRTKARVVGKREPPGKPKLPSPPERKELPPCKIIGTGGTIASRVDYITGGVVSEFTAEELFHAFPEVAELARVSTEQVFNIFSENMTPEHWKILAEEVFRTVKDEKPEGIVITHGTDTMHYTAAALSFMLKTPIPIVLVGAQRSSDRPSSDAALNLLNAINVACYSDLAGTFVVMHASMSDGECAIHLGTRVRKMHTSRRDTFKTIGDTPVGYSYIEARGGKIVKRELKIIKNEWRRRGKVKLEANIRMEEDVYLLKYFPGMKRELFEQLLLNHRWVIIEGTGMGHVREELIPIIKEATESGVFVGVTSQTLFGRVHPHVYSTAVKMALAGAVYLEDMLPETAYVKLMWVLGQTRNLDKAKELMLKNVAGEITERSNPGVFM